MALSNEDKGDVKKKFGSPVAKAISKATRDGGNVKKSTWLKSELASQDARVKNERASEGKSPFRGLWEGGKRVS